MQAVSKCLFHSSDSAMPDPSQFHGGPVYGTGPDYRIHQPAFHSYQVKTYDKVHHYDKAHQPLKTHRYDNQHVYDKIRTYNEVQEYSVKEYKPRFYTAPKPPRPRVPTPTPRLNRPRTPDYKWAELYHCYEEPLGPDITLKDYKCHEYRGCDYNPVMKEYKPPIMNTLSGVQGLYQGNVHYKLTKDNYYPFRKRKDTTKDVPEKYVKKPKEVKPRKKEKSVASLKHVDINENKVREDSTKQEMTSPEPAPIRDESPPHPAPIIVAEKRERSPEKERTFVNEAEKNGLAVGTSVMMVSASTGTDDLKRKKRCSRWTQTTPISSPEPSIREMTPVEIVKKSAIVGVPNKKRVETPAKTVTPQPSPQPIEQQQPLPNNVAPAAVVIASDHRRRRSPTPSPRRYRRRSPSPRSRSPSPRRRSPSPRRYYRNSPSIMPLAGFAAGTVVGGTVVVPVKNRTPTPPMPQPKEKTPSPKPDSAGSRVVPASAVIVGGAVIKDNETKPAKSKSPSPSPKKKSPSPVNEPSSPGPNSPTVVPVVPLKLSPSRNSSPSKEKKRTPSPVEQTAPVVVPVIPVSAEKNPDSPPVKDNTHPSSPSVSLPSIENTSSPSPVAEPVIIPAITTAEVEATKPDNPPPEIPKKEEDPERPVTLSPRPYETTGNSQTEAGPSRRGLPPEVVAALEAYDNVHKNPFGEQVSENSPASVSSAPRSSNLPPEIIASIEAYSKMPRR